MPAVVEEKGQDFWQIHCSWLHNFGILDTLKRKDCPPVLPDRREKQLAETE